MVNMKPAIVETKWDNRVLTYLPHQYAFTLTYSFFGQRHKCNVTEVSVKGINMYKCHLRSSAVMIMIRPIQCNNQLQWIHTKGLVDDLAQTLGASIEMYTKSKLYNQELLSND